MTTQLIPSELIAITLRKKQDYEYDQMMEAWIKCIIPHIYEWQFDLSYTRKMENIVSSVGNLYTLGGRRLYSYSFFLTALKRTCRIMAEDVKLGANFDDYHSRTYQLRKHVWLSSTESPLKSSIFDFT